MAGPMEDCIEKRIDRRVKRTDKLIFEALERLTAKKDLEDITVSDVCKEADISRQAFYARFRDPIHAVESYVDDVFAQGLRIPVPHETPEARNGKLARLWTDNIRVLRLVLVTSRSHYIYDYYVDMVAKLYMELNKVPRSDLKKFDDNEINYEFERSLASVHARMMKRKLETGSDGTFEKEVMTRFFKNAKGLNAHPQNDET